MLDAISGLTAQGQQQAMDELTTLEQTISQASSREPELKQYIEELEQFQNRL